MLEEWLESALKHLALFIEAQRIDPEVQYPEVLVYLSPMFTAALTTMPCPGFPISRRMRPGHIGRKAVSCDLFGRQR